MSFSFRGRIFLASLIFSSYSSHAGSGPNPTHAVISIVTGKATKLPNFIEDLNSSVDFFFDRPGELYLVDKNAPNKSANNFANGLIKDISNVPMCESKASPVSKSLTESYNSSDPVNRRNFFVAASACLATHEGAELLSLGKNATKLDTADAEFVKYLYGSFQLSTERGGGLQEACLKIWNKSFPAKAINFSDKSKGTARNDSAHQHFGRADKQAFNHFCGVHELFRAAFSGSRKNKCFDIFDRYQNRYGPLKTKSSGYKNCLETMGRAALNSGVELTQLKENFANAEKSKSSVVAENVASGPVARLSVPRSPSGPSRTHVVTPKAASPSVSGASKKK